MAVVFLKIGQDVHFEGGSVEEAVNEGVRQGYEEGYLRKSVVGDPLVRVNTKDNTPAIIHYEIVPGDQVEITVAPKGFGSENMSKIMMLKPADGIEGVKEAIVNTVKEAGPNACPPVVVGVGIGGTFEKAAILAKKALTREIGVHSELPHVKALEEELLEKINAIGLGPAGLGGDTTALAVVKIKVCAFAVYHRNRAVRAIRHTEQTLLALCRIPDRSVCTPLAGMKLL